jgi:hypothetical protein
VLSSKDRQKEVIERYQRTVRNDIPFISGSISSGLSERYCTEMKNCPFSQNMNEFLMNEWSKVITVRSKHLYCHTIFGLQSRDCHRWWWQSTGIGNLRVELTSRTLQWNVYMRYFQFGVIVKAAKSDDSVFGGNAGEARADQNEVARRVHNMQRTFFLTG